MQGKHSRFQGKASVKTAINWEKNEIIFCLKGHLISENLKTIMPKGIREIMIHNKKNKTKYHKFQDNKIYFISFQ